MRKSECEMLAENWLRGDGRSAAYGTSSPGAASGGTQERRPYS